MLVQCNHNRCRDIRPHNFPYFFYYSILKSLEKNLTGAVELPGFESGQTIILALIVIFTIVNASPECQTVTINTSIPVLIFFYDLYYEIHLPDYITLAKLPVIGGPNLGLLVPKLLSLIKRVVNIKEFNELSHDKNLEKFSPL